VLLCTVAACDVRQAHAQDISNTTVASPIVLTEQARDGDVVTYNAADRTYSLSRVLGDESMFGVVVDDPLLYMSDASTTPGGRPVVRAGEATVNVSTLGGLIEPGDLVTTSIIPGVGERANRDTVNYILGFALAPVQIDNTITPVTVNGTSVRFGRVPVALRIGPHVPGSLDDLIASTTAALTAGRAQQSSVSEQRGSFDPYKMFRLVLAAAVAISAIVFALRRFGDMFAQSVVSVGRNPLARTQIRAILVWNTFLIMFVSSIGLGIAWAILYVP
jgi:hypothetical protein